MNSNDEIFRNLEREMFAAHEGTPDLSTIDRLYADDFVSINADGRIVNKQEWLEMLRSGKFSVEKIATAEFRVRRYSDTAVITGRSSYFSSGSRLFDVRHTQIWVQMAGRWRMVGWQGTAAPAES